MSNDNIIWSDVKKMTLNEHIEFLSSLRDEVGGETDVCIDEDGEYAKDKAVTKVQIDGRQYTFDADGWLIE